MTATLLNTDIHAQLWVKMFSRERLRQLARHHGITRGRDKMDTALHLSIGLPYPCQSIPEARDRRRRFITFTLQIHTNHNSV